MKKVTNINPSIVAGDKDIYEQDRREFVEALEELIVQVKKSRCPRYLYAVCNLGKEHTEENQFGETKVIILTKRGEASVLEVIGSMENFKSEVRESFKKEFGRLT